MSVGSIERFRLPMVVWALQWAQMRLPRKGIILGTALAVAALVVVFWKSRPRQREPVFDGKTLSEWVVLLDSHTDHKAENEAAANALQNMGATALPGLIRILHKRPDPPLVEKAKAMAMRLGLLRPPELYLPEFQYRAARACCVLGGWHDVGIQAAIPGLAYSLTNKTPYHTLEPFAWALVYAGPEGVSVITNALATHPLPQVREAAAHSLWITPKVRTPEISRALVSATQDADTSVRVTALLTLKSFARQKDLESIIVPGVLRCLQDSNPYVRRWTVELLGSLSSSPEVGAALTIMLSDPDPTVRSQAERWFESKAGGVEK